ncbi:MAG: succinate dehydrogenase, cytochrome b556 subunit [Gammaproteobacteria bacterium]|nr:succinate dehydrogenase, cytochrome b556 subunit [Gammaproteobacteria bacterium]
MNSDRPVNLPLPRLALAMPVTAVASILHRITGVVLFVGMFFLCYLLDRAMADAAGFEQAAATLDAPFGKLGLWAVLTSLAYHAVAGVKHLLLDFHVGDSLEGGRVGAWISLAAAAVAGVVLAVWLW